MSIDKHIKENGIELTEDNTFPLKQRTQKMVKRLIAAVRAAEAEFNDELRDANDRCRQSQDEVIKLQRKCWALENELKKFKIKEKLLEYDNLTTADKTRLIEATS